MVSETAELKCLSVDYHGTVSFSDCQNTQVKSTFEIYDTLATGEFRVKVTDFDYTDEDMCLFFHGGDNKIIASACSEDGTDVELFSSVEGRIKTPVRPNLCLHPVENSLGFFPCDPLNILYKGIKYLNFDSEADIESNARRLTAAINAGTRDEFEQANLISILKEQQRSYVFLVYNEASGLPYDHHDGIYVFNSETKKFENDEGKILQLDIQAGMFKLGHHGVSDTIDYEHRARLSKNYFDAYSIKSIEFFGNWCSALDNPCGENNACHSKTLGISCRCNPELLVTGPTCNIPTPCGTFPCKNNGKCTEVFVNGVLDYECDCTSAPRDFYGQNCNTCDGGVGVNGVCIANDACMSLPNCQACLPENPQICAQCEHFYHVDPLTGFCEENYCECKYGIPGQCYYHNRNHCEVCFGAYILEISADGENKNCVKCERNEEPNSLRNGCDPCEATEHSWHTMEFLSPPYEERGPYKEIHRELWLEQQPLYNLTHYEFSVKAEGSVFVLLQMVNSRAFEFVIGNEVEIRYGVDGSNLLTTPVVGDYISAEEYRQFRIEWSTDDLVLSSGTQLIARIEQWSNIVAMTANPFDVYVPQTVYIAAGFGAVAHWQPTIDGSCKECDINTYRLYDMIDCEPCEENFYRNNDNGDMITCQPCPDDKPLRWSDRYFCHGCNEGTYLYFDADGNPECVRYPFIDNWDYAECDGTVDDTSEFDTLRECFDFCHGKYELEIVQLDFSACSYDMTTKVCSRYTGPVQMINKEYNSIAGKVNRCWIKPCPLSYETTPTGCVKKVWQGEMECKRFHGISDNPERAYLFGGDFDGDGYPDTICVKSFRDPSSGHISAHDGRYRLAYGTGTTIREETLKHSWCFEDGAHIFMTNEDNSGVDVVTCLLGSWQYSGKIQGFRVGEDNADLAADAHQWILQGEATPAVWDQFCRTTEVNGEQIEGQIFLGDFNNDGYRDWVCNHHHENRLEILWGDDGMVQDLTTEFCTEVDSWITAQDIYDNGLSTLICRRQDGTAAYLTIDKSDALNNEIVEDPTVFWVTTGTFARCREFVFDNKMYRGCQQRTREDRTCQPWDQDIAHLRYGTMLDGTYKGIGQSGTHNFCRHTSGAMWCYTIKKCFKTEPNYSKYCQFFYNTLYESL